MAGLLVSLLLFSVVWVFVVVAEILEIGIAVDLVHSVDYQHGQPSEG
ncbi:hypothetical protein [Sphingomonas sp. PWP1-2]